MDNAGFTGHETDCLDDPGGYTYRLEAFNPANQSVIIRADRRVQLDSAVFVMNACNKAGIFDYTLTTSGEEN